MVEKFATPNFLLCFVVVRFLGQCMSAQLAGGLIDDELAAALRMRAAAGEPHVLVIANKFSARVLASATASPTTWSDLGVGDIGPDALKVLEAAAKRQQVQWIETSASDVSEVDYAASGPAIRAIPTQMRSWCKERDKITGTSGRHGEVDAATRFEVASRAGWRCQFDGCGENLRHHFVPGATGNYSYFAHIVASSKDGPRGNEVKSPLLANDPSNIMLMCDKCHRLIDRVAPERYGADYLNEMRQRNVAEVSKLLDTLRYPAAQMLVIGGNIEGQSFAFDERIAEEAMWLRRLRTGGGRAEWFARNGAHLGASNSDGYWLSLFHLLKNDKPRLAGLLDGSAYGGAPRPPLAVFPLHGTSVLVLSGRLIGDSSSAHVFQFHRDQVSGQRGGQWAWPEAMPTPANDKFKVEVRHHAQGGETEACLRINLTAAVPGSDLPKHLFSAAKHTMPTIEITVENPSHRVIGHPSDLELLGRAVDQAMQKLQDAWRVSTVHLLVVAPATACFRIGQKMQARHHAEVILYERKPSTTPGARGEFAKTIAISPTDVTLLSTGESISIS